MEEKAPDYNSLEYIITNEPFLSSLTATQFLIHNS